jgi:Ca2+-binding EF-hand superfamily protein
MKAKKLSPKQAFAMFDTNKDGTLDLGELTKLCQHLGLSLPNEKIEFVFRAIDLDNS